MHELRFTTATAALAQPRGDHGGPDRPRYHPDALRAVQVILRTLSSDAAAIVAAIIELRGEQTCLPTGAAEPGWEEKPLRASAGSNDVLRREHTRFAGEGRSEVSRRVSIDALAGALQLNRAALCERLIQVDRQLQGVFSVTLIDATWHFAAIAARTDAGIFDDSDQPAAPSSSGELDGEDDVEGSDETGKSAGPASNSQADVLLSRSFVDLLDRPQTAAAGSAAPPQLDAPGKRAIDLVGALVSARKGGHLAIRRTRSSAREAADIVALVGKTGRETAALKAVKGPPVIILKEGSEDLLGAILRAELHAGATPPVILVERDVLTSSKTADTNDDEFEPAPSDAAAEPSAFATRRPDWFSSCRGVYLWSVPGQGDLPPTLATWIGGCAGPLRPDPAWARAMIANEIGLPGNNTNTSPGVRAVVRRLGDARDAGAIARAAHALARHDNGGLDPLTIDRALIELSASFVDRPAAETTTSGTFDPRLLVCGPEAFTLIERARQAAANGARVLAHGPPGGGKSAYVRALARAMAGGGPVRIIGPADFLARAWGKTERLVRAVWRRAVAEGEILVCDEFEVVCGRRIAGDTSNNAMLTRSLTDAWLVALDEHPGVPLLATTNDIAIDPAALRRFAFVLEFGDRLSADQERLAWSVILGCEPPRDWRATGAAVADYVLAKERCRMLGVTDARALKGSVEAARRARLGVHVEIADRQTIRVATRH